MEMSSISDRGAFLQAHRISAEQFKASLLDWEDLEVIHAKHRDSMETLAKIGRVVAETLQDVSAVHSVRMRIKTPGSVVAKIIRKRADNPDPDKDASNCYNGITDLVGVRALHLFKDQWRAIDNFIGREWRLEETPIVYVKASDPKEFQDALREAGLEVMQHEASYRSIHYLIESSLGGRKNSVEIQVRTVFEEGWSEIDHAVRYPQVSSDEKLGKLLEMFSLFAGMADNLGTFIRDYSVWMEARDSETERLENELRESISLLTIAEEEKDKLRAQLDSLKISSETGHERTVTLDSIYPQAPNTLSSLTLQNQAESYLAGIVEQMDSTVMLGGRKCSKCGELFFPSITNAIYLDQDTCPECIAKGLSSGEDGYAT